MSPPIVDAHSDLLWELVFAEDVLGEADPFRSRWLDALRCGGIALQVCAVYVDAERGPGNGLRDVLRQVVAFHNAVESNADSVFAVERSADLEGIGGDRIGLMLALEGVAAFGEDTWPVEVLARLGVRMASLTWNERNAFAVGCHHAGGLTTRGRTLLQRLWELGIVPDLAHASPQTVTDVLARADGRPVIVSHAACAAVYDHPRNVADAQLRVLAEQGGVLSLMPHPLVVDPRAAKLDRFLEHLDHAVATMGIEHVGLGGDFLRQISRTLGTAGQADSEGVRIDAVIEGLEGPQDYPTLLAALRSRGYEQEAIAKLAGGNLWRLLRDGLPG